MTSYTRWNDVRAAHVERAGGEDAVVIRRDELLAGAAGQSPAPGSPRRILLSAVAEYLAGSRSAAALIRATGEVLARCEEPPESVVALAAATASSSDELAPVARAAVREVGYPELDPAFRSRVLALDLARSVTSGDIAAGAGASTLWELGRESDQGADRFAVFAQLADEWESNRAERGEVEKEIRQAASWLLAETELDP